MRLLPLILSAHPSAWNSDVGASGRQGRMAFQDSPCRFCGCLGAGWQEPFHVNGDHDDNDASNVVSGCVLCHLTQHLDRPEIEQETTLIWLPEMSQAALISLARHIHLDFHSHGEPPHGERRPRRDTPSLRNSYSAYRALLQRRGALSNRLDVTSPRDIGAALLRLPETAYGSRAELMAGIRLLPLGRFYRNGVDVYARLLDALPNRRLVG